MHTGCPTAADERQLLRSGYGKPNAVSEKLPVKQSWRGQPGEVLADHWRCGEVTRVATTSAGSDATAERATQATPWVSQVSKSPSQNDKTRTAQATDTDSDRQRSALETRVKLQQFPRRSATVLVGWSLSLSVWAFGDKPLMFIVPAPAGGTVDIAARVIGQKMSEDLGRPVVVENRPGATGSIALSAMLRANPDGNTIVLGPNNMLVEAPQVMKVPYDPLKDIVSIARVALTSYVLVTATSYPAQDFKTLVSRLKTRKGKSSFASYGIGTVSQYSGLIFNSREGLDMQHVAYTGSPPALLGLMGGEVDIMFDGMVSSLPFIRSGKLRAYAVSGKGRSRYLPDVPTMTELGYPEIQFQGQVCFYGSSKLPPAVLENLAAVIKKAVTAPAVQQKLVDVGLEPEMSVDASALLAENKVLSQRNAAIVKKFDIRAN
jgi:tripartite-type tricarboxylate transporter receptor subunit TctC